MVMMAAAMGGKLLLQAGQRLLGVGDIAGLQIAADLLQGLPQRTMRNAWILAERRISLLSAGEIARIDRLDQLVELLGDRVLWRLGVGRER